MFDLSSYTWQIPLMRPCRYSLIWSNISYISLPNWQQVFYTVFHMKLYFYLLTVFLIPAYIPFSHNLFNHCYTLCSFYCHFCCIVLFSFHHLLINTCLNLTLISRSKTLTNLKIHNNKSDVSLGVGFYISAFATTRRYKNTW